MRTPIKSKDLCERCKYFFGRACGAIDCSACEMRDDLKDGYMRCKCWDIDFNTPCPYFKEAEENAAD